VLATHHRRENEIKKKKKKIFFPAPLPICPATKNAPEMAAYSSASTSSTCNFILLRSIFQVFNRTVFFAASRILTSYKLGSREYDGSQFSNKKLTLILT
jgi:hypothetical protein